MLKTETGPVESLRVRRAGKDALSVALIESRNHSLRWFGVIEEAVAGLGAPARLPAWVEALTLLGHAGWYQEYWVGRNLQRSRGTRCDRALPRRASIEQNADRWWTSVADGARPRVEPDRPSALETKRYLADTIDGTLELLATADETDDALYFYRLALFHEDLLGEACADLAQSLPVPLDLPPALLQRRPAPLAQPPLRFEPCTWNLGSVPGGFVFDNEKWAHPVAVGAFEIDASAVDWAQFAAFIEDGGYDELRWWSADGRRWLRAQDPKRLPRYAEQVRHGAVLRRFGHRVQAALGDPATHLTLYEAEAWCRWAGRRLPTELEWEVAAYLGAAAGFSWGTAWEWTASPFRPYPSFSADPDASYSEPFFGSTQVLRGASLATRGRLRHPKFRKFKHAASNGGLNGFRSCAL